MDKFIEVHLFDGDKIISLNVNYISSFIPCVFRDSHGTEILMTNGAEYTIKESYDTIKCLIHDIYSPMSMI